MRSVELFVGAGGLAIGTAHAGFTHESVIDFDQFACATLRRNKADGVAPARNWEIIERDVREYDFSRHKGNADVVIGGPPCQPFSLGGKHLGAADHRNMFPQAVRAVREIAPKAFMFENVRGLLRQGELVCGQRSPCSPRPDRWRGPEFDPWFGPIGERPTWIERDGVKSVPSENAQVLRTQTRPPGQSDFSPLPKPQ